MQMLTFDPALNQYEISGSELDAQSLAYLESIKKNLKRYDIVFPALFLQGKKIRATLAGQTYTLGEVQTEGSGAQQIVYPYFGKPWDFDFTRDIVHFQVWKEQDADFRAGYSSLVADLLKTRGEDAKARINLALLKEFVALARVEGGRTAETLLELSFLRGMISLYYLGLVQKKHAASLGVRLVERATVLGRRVRRAGGQSLILLLDEDIAAGLLYRGITYENLSPAWLVAQYFSYKRRAALETPEDLQRFSLALQSWVESYYSPMIDHDSQMDFIDSSVRAYSDRFPSLFNLLNPEGVLPADPKAVRGFFTTLDQELVRLRKEHLDRVITRDRALEVYTISTRERFSSSHYTRLLSGGLSPQLGGEGRPVDVLSIDYVSPVGADASFGGTIHLVGHGSIFGLGTGSSPSPYRIADWMYANFSRTFGRTPDAFKRINCINFTSCHFPKALADYVTLQFLERCLNSGHFDVLGERGIKVPSIPNVTVICSPHSSLVYNFRNTYMNWGPPITSNRMAPLPGVVLRTMDTMGFQSRGHFLSQSGVLDFDNVVVQQFLERTHVFSTAGLVGGAFEHGVVSQAQFVQAQSQITAAYQAHEQGLAAEQRRRNAEAGSLIGLASGLFGPVDVEQHRARMAHLAYELASVKPKGETAFLRANTFETMHLLHGYYAEIRNRYASRTASGVIDRDPQRNSQQYQRALDELKRENRIKILLDPLDPAYHYKRTLIVKAFREHLGIVYREFQDFPFYSAHLGPSRLPYGGFSEQPDNYASTSHYDQQLAEILLVVTKQEYQQITGIELDNLWDVGNRVVSAETFREVQRPGLDSQNMILLDAPLTAGLLGSDQLGVSSADLRTALMTPEGGDVQLAVLAQLDRKLQAKRSTLRDALSLKTLQDTQENLRRTKTAIEKKQVPGRVLRTSARMARGASRLLGAFGVFMDFRTQPFHLDFSSLRSGVLSVSDSLAVTKGLFDFSIDVGVALRLRLASSAFRAIWQARLDRLFFKLNKLLLPLDVLFTAVSLYRNIEGVRLAKSTEEQALYLAMTVIDGLAFGVSLAGFALIAVPGVGVALILVGVALAVVNIILNAIVSLSSLEDYRWHEKVGLFFDNFWNASALFSGQLTVPSTALEGITAQQNMRQAADQLFEGDTQASIVSLPGQGIDLLLTPVLNDADDQDRTNALKQIGPSGHNPAQGYTLAPLGLTADELRTWPDGKAQGKAQQVRKGWYVRRAPGSGPVRKLMVTMPATPGAQSQVLDFGPLPAVLLFGSTPHLLLGMNPFGWAQGESPQEQSRQAYQVKLYPGVGYTWQFRKRVMESKDHDSHFDSRTRLLVPEGDYSSLPQVTLDLSSLEDGRETIRELDLSGSSLEVTRFKGRSKVHLELVGEGSKVPCALEQVVRTVQLPAHITFKSGRSHPVMAVVDEGSKVVLRNAEGQSLLLLRPPVNDCEIEVESSVSGFAISI